MKIIFEGLEENNCFCEYLSKIAYDVFKESSTDIEITEKSCDIRIDGKLEKITFISLMGKLILCNDKPLINKSITLNIVDFIHGDKNFTPIYETQTDSEGIFSFLLQDFSNSREYLIKL